MSHLKKTTAKKPLKRQQYEEHHFRDRDAFEEFSKFYKDVVIIVEKACLRGLEEEEGTPGEDNAHEGGNTDDEIENFTLEPKDMEASPTQL
nr:hypothetical protein CFP56_33857 [Quercus suber]